MAKIERFEDLQSWQKARQLTNLVYDLSSHTEFTKDFRLRGQIRDAAGSAIHNVAEGFDAGSNPEFIRFLKMARRSASEVQSQSYLALDRNYINDEELISAYNLATESKKLINGMIGYLRQHP
jgi:four helix bundle protein